MIFINNTNWQTAPTQKENALIKHNWDVFKAKLETFKSVQNGTGTVFFSNNDFNKTKFVLEVTKNHSSLSNKFWIDLLNMYFPDDIGG